MNLDHDYGKITHIQTLDTTQTPPQGGTAGLLSITGTGAIKVPSGTTAQQPAIQAGMIRYNTTTQAFEFAQGASPIWYTNSWPKPISIVLVNTASNLPAAITGVRTLVANTIYWISGDVNIGTDTIVLSDKSVIRGLNDEVDKLTYTGSGTFITSVNKTIEISDISLVCGSGTVFSISGSGTESVHLEHVNLRSCKTLGTVSGMHTFRTYDSDIKDTTTGGFTMSGTFTSFEFINNTCSNNAGVMLNLDSITVSQGEILGNIFTVSGGQTGISSSAPTISSQIVVSSNTFSGAGTYTSGISVTNIRFTLIGNYGISNTSYVGEMYYAANATSTTITTPGTFYKVSGTTTAGQNVQFTHTNGTLTCNALDTRYYLVTCSISASCGTNNQLLGLRIYKGGSPVSSSEMEVKTGTGGDSESGVCKSIVQLATNEYLELYVTNKTAGNAVTVEYMNFTIIGI